MNYTDFLESKIEKQQDAGFEVADAALNSNLFPFQKHIVKWGLQKGRAAIFADCGLGKTIMQLEWARLVVEHTGQPVLILCPLAVAGQTVKEGAKFGIEVTRYFPDYFVAFGVLKGIYISNYEQLDNIHTADFAGVVLDESSILKNFTGSTKKKLIESFADTPYRLCCTATPAPNDLNEIGNHSEFLSMLDAQDMRSKWFVRDEGMNNYRLKGHAKSDFFAWVSSWAMMLCNPADIGFPMPGYDLPELNIIERQITTEKRESNKLFNDVAVNATNFNSELRLTIIPRLDMVKELVNSTDENFIIWTKQNDEGIQLRKLLPEAIEVQGSDAPDKKEKNLLGFANNEFRLLITKTKIAQFGLNYQNCNNQIFASLDFSFEGLYQAIRRSYRFGQTKPVNIYLITTDTMENVINSIRQKEAQFKEMQQEMNKAVNSKKYGLLNTYEFKEEKTPDYWLMKGDSCLEIKRIHDNSVDLIVFSPPFSSLFTYSNYIHDMGNNESHADFFKQYAFLLQDLYRILKPGRLMCCHTKDLGVYKNSSGYTGMYDFTGDHHRAVEQEGFKFHSKITIWTDPVLEMQRTKTQRLLYKTLTTDSSYTGIGMPEYVTVFRKWEGDEQLWEPVNHLTKKNIGLDVWQRWASPVWMDIKRTDVLNNWRNAKAMGDEKHIAPLQLEVINRLVNLWSNPGETVFTPFLGIGSEAYMSLLNKRKAIGIELKDSYFEQAVMNCRNASQTNAQLKLFA